MIKIIISFNLVLFSFAAFFNPNVSHNENPMDNMPMCVASTQMGQTSGFGNNFPPFEIAKTTPSVFGLDDNKAYSMPTLSQTPKGEILLSWTEKDEKGMVAFCFSTSNDKGKTFSDKKVIFLGAGINNSRLFRAKLLAKKDGSLVAVFANRPDAQPMPTGTQPQAQQRPQGSPPQSQGGGGRGGRGGGRSSELVYVVSKDAGNTWTNPKSVDSDTSKLMRGFFDAIVLPNDEIAVVYLKDVKGSTKHEERDLRMVTTKNGVFQPEKLLDAVVCDCCNINMLIDANGALNVYYRDNNDDIRDIARLTSKDNGETFSKSQIVHNDGWKIAGCPHSGAISSQHGKSALIAWYSGTETESGIRLVTQEGKKLFVLNDPSVKNPALTTSAQVSAMLWEQGSDKTQLIFRTINDDKVSGNTIVEGSENATNLTSLIIGNQLLIAYEVKQENKMNTLKVTTTSL
ncbi:MAG: exo-alpha-sialidase [Saprospiraceae bacterium]|nr:exo-alpha-sialidase [Saprospiraceae bacterium]